MTTGSRFQLNQSEADASMDGSRRVLDSQRDGSVWGASGGRLPAPRAQP
jgi:hypothetical protein